MSNELLSLCDTIFNNKNSFVGFNDFFNDLSKFDLGLTERGIKDSFPPYNIYTREINVAGKDETPMTMKHTFIEIACAGFKKEELKITFVDGVLTVKGYVNRKEAQEVKYAYKGIGTRMFERQWKLSTDLKFTKASYENGILTIEFEPEIKQYDGIKELPIE